MTKSKELAESKNYEKLFKLKNGSTKFPVMRFLIFKVRVTFMKLSKYLPKLKSFIILIFDIISRLKEIFLTIILIKF